MYCSRNQSMPGDTPPNPVTLAPLKPTRRGAGRDWGQIGRALFTVMK
jgi:hypothetical protein